MREIHIFLDHVPYGTCSYEEVLKRIEEKREVIFTNCTVFFDFDYLDKGYDVIVFSGGKSIVLSELLGDNIYTVKHIRRAHNVHKMLMAGALKFHEKELLAHLCMYRLDNADADIDKIRTVSAEGSTKDEDLGVMLFCGRTKKDSSIRSTLSHVLTNVVDAIVPEEEIPQPKKDSVSIVITWTLYTLTVIPMGTVKFALFIKRKEIKDEEDE